MILTDTSTLSHPIAPERFSSVSEPRDSSIVLPELNSVTGVNWTSGIEYWLSEEIQEVVELR